MAGIIGRNQIGYPYAAFPGAQLQQVPGFQTPGYGWTGMPQAGQQGMMQQPGQTGQMSKPTVHADIIQIENEAAGENEPVDAGTSQMMITKDENAILIKSVLANGETTMDVYRKQPKAPKEPEPEYVTREEFERWVEQIRKREQEPVRKKLRVLDPDEEDEAEYEETKQAPVPRIRSTTGGKRA